MRTPLSLPRRQHGAVLILLVIALGVLAAVVFVGMLSSSDIQNQRDKKTVAALAEAKAALIGYAASDLNRPGELPCPDYDGDGQITLAGDYAGSNCRSYVGRLPWRTLGLDDLRDGSGEPLWYAVSSNFHANGSTPLNSSVPGQLSLSGITPTTNIVAIVFAPGPALAGQSRTLPVVATPPNIANYLDGSNNDGDTQFELLDQDGAFNDKLILLTHHDLFSVVERTLLNMIMGTGSAPTSGLRAYFQSHGTYPPLPLDYATLNLSASNQSMISSNAWNTQIGYSLPNSSTARLAAPAYCTADSTTGQPGNVVCH